MDVAALLRSEIPNIPGWCTVEKALKMAQLAVGASLCVELGVFGGRGLVALAAPLKAQGFGAAHGIDPFTADAALEGTNSPENDEWWSKLDLERIFAEAQSALRRLELASVAEILRGRSQDLVGRYADGAVDVLHQDSNHSEEVSCAEVELWTPKIRPGGYWIFDDTDWSTTQRAQLELASRGFKLIENHGSWKVFEKI